MDRAQFEQELFGFSNLANLPIGHLLDHRVRAPEDLCESIFAQGERAIRTHLRNMLCSQHFQGPDLVAEALRLQPENDSLLLLDASRSYPDFVRLCFSGRQGYALPYLASAPRGDAPKLRRILISTAVYFGALELQLIAVRLRAISEYRFGVVDRKTTDTMGSLIGSIRQLVAGLKKARSGVFSNAKLLGRKPDLIAFLKPLGDEFLERIYRERPDLTEAELLEELRGLYSSIIDPIIAMVDTGLKPFPSNDETADANGNEGAEAEVDDGTTSGFRQRIPTAWGGGVTGGVQLAFASLRLHAFARKLPEIVGKLEKGFSRPDVNWFAPLAGDRNKHVARLVLVSRSATWAKNQYPAAYALNGTPIDLKCGLEDWLKAEKLPNTELLFETKRASRGWQEDAPASESGPLAGPQLWDIHPDYRFASDDLRPVQPAAGIRAPKGFDVKPNQPSPRHRAPAASHRPC